MLLVKIVIEKWLIKEMVIFSLRNKNNSKYMPPKFEKKKNCEILIKNILKSHRIK